MLFLSAIRPIGLTSARAASPASDQAGNDAGSGNDFFHNHLAVANVPEPGTASGLIVAAAGGLAGFRRTRRAAGRQAVG